jgi:putative NADH-flavin reductase
MRVAVLGSTGPTGILVVKEALRRGHDVVAMARNPAKLEWKDPRLSVVQGDVIDSNSLKGAFDDVDGVISCVGSPTTRPPITVYSQGTRNIVDAMLGTRARRVVVLSSGAVRLGKDPNFPLFFELIVRPFILKHVYADMRKMEELLTHCTLDWTLVRPSRLTDKPGEKPLREVVSGYSLADGHWTSRDRLAECLVKLFEDKEAVAKAYGVAN